MHILGAKGFSNSGKTTALTLLTRYLKEQKSYRVFIAKDIHKEGVRFDEPGKDTAKYRESGADFVLGVTLEDAAIFIPPTIPVVQVVQMAHALGVDVLIIEGFAREYRCPRILCAKSTEELHQWPLDDVMCITGVVVEAEHLGPEYRGIPVFDSLKNPDPFLKFILGTLR